METREIVLTNGRTVLVDADDYEVLKKYSWHCLNTKYTSYAQSRINGENGKKQHTLMHRLIMNTPKGMDTDHINGNGLDNRKENLRITNHRENMRNRHANNKYKGVYYRADRKVYHAYIKVGRTRNLGHFVSEIAAACAYDYAAKEYFGEFACLNFPNNQPLTIEQVEQQRYKRSKSSLYRGVHWYKSRSKWQASITVNYKQIKLGYFDSEMEAAEAYNNAATLYLGENAVLNPPTKRGR